MSVNLFDLELANIEHDKLHKPLDASDTTRINNHRRLATRRAIEDHLEQQRLRDELYDVDLEVF